MQPYGCGFGCVFLPPRPFPFASVTAASSRAPNASKPGSGAVPLQLIHILEKRDIGPQRGQRPEKQRAVALLAQACVPARPHS